MPSGMTAAVRPSGTAILRVAATHESSLHLRHSGCGHPLFSSYRAGARIGIGAGAREPVSAIYSALVEDLAAGVGRGAGIRNESG